jgi:hypothetical protein
MKIDLGMPEPPNNSNPPINRATSPYNANSPSSPPPVKELVTPSNLVFLIHGMGGFKEFRLEQMISTFRSVVKEDFADIDSQRYMHFIPIEWHAGLHGLDTTKRLGPCNLPTASVLRRINNEMLSDVLYYFTNFHGQKIVNHVVEAFNKQYAAFMKIYPDFNGKVGIFGHSLGGIISYDILAHHKENHLSGEKSSRSTRRSSFQEIVYLPLNFKPRFDLCHLLDLVFYLLVALLYQLLSSCETWKYLNTFCQSGAPSSSIPSQFNRLVSSTSMIHSDTEWNHSSIQASQTSRPCPSSVLVPRVQPLNTSLHSTATL